MTTKTKNLDQYRQVPMTFRLPMKLYEELKVQAEKENVTVSKWIRDRLIDETGMALFEPVALNAGNLTRSITLPYNLVCALSDKAESKKVGLGEFVQTLLEKAAKR